MSDFTIIAHRGSSGIQPENTLRAFKQAVKDQADGIEFDVHLAENNKVVVIHDPSLERTSNGTGSIASTEFTKLRELDFGEGETIPLLDEAMEAIPSSMLVNIELKGTGTGSTVGEMCREYPQRRMMVSSFSIEELREFNRSAPKLPSVQIALLHDRFQRNLISKARSVGATALNLMDPWVNTRTVRKVLNEGLQIYVWTVNDLDRVRVLKRMGVNGVFTDFPNLINHKVLG